MLVVDDDWSLREFYRLELEGEGYDVDLASDGLQAKEMLQDSRYDIVILDIRKPEMRGIDFLQNIIAHHNHQSVVLNTSYRLFRNNFRKWLSVACVITNYSTVDLKRAIKSLLANEP
jgi:DNA-binding NtrC family response regulator